jgi:protein-L-isoaspartate(D-aspartate) O-methyltransferase
VISLLAIGSDGSPVQAQNFEEERRSMVDQQIERRGVCDRQVLEAMREVPRHEFVPAGVRTRAYHDHPLPIGFGQTISQPYIVAFMLEQLLLKATDRVLELGTGSGYQTAILSKLVGQVFSIEIIDELSRRAAADFQRLGYVNILLKSGDGYKGWPEFAPFDAIVVAAAPDHVPEALTDQLREGGRMVIPIGNAFDQNLLLIEKRSGATRKRVMCPVRFVPFTRKKTD